MWNSLSICFLILFTIQPISASPTKIILCNSGNVIGNPSIKIEVDQGQLVVEKWRTSGYSNSEGNWYSLPLQSFDEGLCENCYTLNWNFMNYRGANNPEVQVDVKYVVKEDSSGLIAHEWRKAEDETSWWRNGSIGRPDRCLVF